MSTTDDDRATLERALAARATDQVDLTLFVTGTSELSMRAIVNLRALCETHLAGRYNLEVVDVLRDPSQMAAFDVVAAPTLIKHRPLPLRRLVGDLSDSARVLAAFGVVTES